MYGSKENLPPAGKYIRDERSRIGAWADFKADYPRSNDQSKLIEHLKQDNKQSL